MGDKTDYAEDRIQNALFGDETLTPPDNWYVGLARGLTDKEAGTELRGRSVDCAGR